MNQHAKSDLTPPTKAKPTPAAKAAAATTNGAPTAAEAGTPAKEKKPRAPRTDYGFSPEATIGINKEKAAKYRGQRLEWFNRISAFDGQKVAGFLTKYENAKTAKGSDDPPRGWVRFFVQDGTVVLTKPAAAAS